MGRQRWQVFRGFWFARYLICAGVTILEGPKRKIAREAAINLKYYI